VWFSEGNRLRMPWMPVSTPVSAGARHMFAEAVQRVSAENRVDRECSNRHQGVVGIQPASPTADGAQLAHSVDVIAKITRELK
jgi:hypothetical protein